MMGRSHLLLGAAGYLGVASLAPGLLDAQALSPAELVAGTLVASGAAMLPDLDHPQGTVSRSLGPVSWFASRVVNKLAGGHRWGTHCLLAWLGCTLGVSAALYSTSGPWVALFIAFFCASLMLRVLTEARGAVCAGLACILGGAAVMAAPRPEWMVAAVSVGYALHILGDLVTTEGVPHPLYPLRRTRVAVPVIGSTDHWRERSTGAICGIIAVYLLVTMVFLPTWETQSARADSRTSSAVSSSDAAHGGERNQVSSRDAQRELARARTQLRHSLAREHKH